MELLAPRRAVQPLGHTTHLLRVVPGTENALSQAVFDLLLVVDSQQFIKLCLENIQCLLRIHALKSDRSIISTNGSCIST